LKKRIGILTGGGDVPGLNPAIRGVTLRALKEGFEVIGIRRGWAGLINIIRDKEADNSENFISLTPEIVNRIARTGGTFLHSSRTRPSHVKLDVVPDHLKDKFTAPVNDLTPEVLKNLEFLGVDYLIPIGGDDTLSYGVTLHKAGFKVVGIPKTMDNDVPGTDYCIGFSTCVTRTIELTNALRTSAGSHERFLVIEVFGRYAGFSALVPALAGISDRCVIPEYKFSMERLAELMVGDRKKNPSHYSTVLISEGAMLKEQDSMVFQGDDADAFGHKKLGGIGDIIGKQLKDLSAKYNNGRKIEVIGQKLGYLVRCGSPDAFDSIVPMAYGNNAFELILKGQSGLLVNLRNGVYGHTNLEVVTSTKKVVDVEKFYDTDRLRPKYESFEQKPFFIMTSDK
jgi:6-phosphofructokinase 1